MVTWQELSDAEPDLEIFGRRLLLNCAPTWGVALLGTTKQAGAPRISPLCVYVIDGRLLVTVEGLKAKDLDRDARCFLHSYWADGQDEFAVEAAASTPISGDELQELIRLEDRIRWCPVRELNVLSAHSVVYRNFPTPEMFAEVTIWRPDSGTRRWVRDESSHAEEG